MLQLLIHDEDRTLVFPLADGEHLVGSGPECPVRLGHPTVSGRHARLVVDGDSCSVEDLGSRNGTRAGEASVKQKTVVEPGARLSFGMQSGLLEAVADADVEAAVRFEPPTSPEPVPEADPERLTIRGAALERLVLDHLPGLVDSLKSAGDVNSVAARAGAALYETLPCLSAEVGCPGASTVFSASRTEVEAPELMTVENEAVTIRLGFAHRSLAGAVRPAVELVARLVALQAGPGPVRRRVSDASDTPPLPDPPTVDPAVRRLYRDAARVAPGDVSVLIHGESGTGKELLARYVHAASRRAGAAFIALNCAALPSDLLEAELFGIEEGVATGVAARPGMFELADQGTLFLDEIGDMATETQAKILRALQEGEIYRVGGSRARPARARIIAATNRSLEDMLESGKFRSDLYYRIADWSVTVPALRDRPEDIPNLAAHFLRTAATARGADLEGISRSALDALTAYSWPGNVRQLEREMARVALFLDGGQLLQRHHLQESIRRHEADGKSLEGTLKERLESVERREIAASLSRHEGNLSAAARELGIARSTLYRRLRELGLGDPAT